MLFRLMLLVGLAATAHEIGTTRVTAQFAADGTYAVTIETDGTALLEKLSAATGRAGELGSFDEVFRRRVALAFDGVEVRPDITYSMEKAAPSPFEAPGATIRLTGSTPAGAREFTWKFGWTFASYALTIGGGKTVWLEGGRMSAPMAVAVAAPEGRWQVAWQYLTLGFTHILPYGLDHVLFVLGLFLLNGRARSVLLQVTAFTVAHSITLGLSMYGLLHVPASIVEPLIAISIAYVAIENLFLSELKPWRVALVFAFGLLHGMGFAGVLTELGLPRTEFLTALLTFNLGVEAGQLAVIGVAFLLVGWHWAGRTWYRSRVVIPASMLIACAAVYWTIERVAG
ncbi:MAG: HupE/UreJ family protein [Bryobacteraceae bacterium]